MQTIVLGVGYIDQAHQPDRYLGLEQMQPMVRIIESLVQRFCVAYQSTDRAVDF